MAESRSYVILDNIKPPLRNVLTFLLLALGYLLQVNTRSIFPGLPFIAACLIVNLIKGVSVPQQQAVKLEWQEVTPVKLTQAYEHCRKLRKFQSANIGCIVAVFFFIGWFAFFMIPFFNWPITLRAAILDAVILIAGLAFSGRKSAWIPPGLEIKADIVRRFLASPLVTKDPELQAMPYLEIGQTKTGGTFPNDARFMIRFKDAPESFIGLQGQISINAVKSTQYPYFYVVIIAKPGFQIFKKFGKPTLKNITIENKETGEVDVIVIRQFTTQTSGYHTNTTTQEAILAAGIKAVKGMLTAG
jgi:hypothetical protein